MYAMNVARFQRFPESRRQGGRVLPRLVLFASEEVGTAMGAGGGWQWEQRPEPPACCPHSATTPSRKEPPSWASALTTSSWCVQTRGGSAGIAPG